MFHIHWKTLVGIDLGFLIDGYAGSLIEMVLLNIAFMHALS